MHQFSIITPTYNRVKYLPRIYDSLLQQNDVDFEWIIVDDGSSDNTKEVVEKFKKTFKIKYYYQENRGKPSAVNAGIQMADSYISTYFDSDDKFCPNILKTIWKYFDAKTKKFEHECVCVTGLCQYDDGELIGRKFPHDYYVSDPIRYLDNKNHKSDSSEFFLTAILKEYPYPVFENEKNVSPSIVWNRIALAYKTIFVNIIFIEKQFLPDGLSTQNYDLMYPIGAEIFHNEASIPPFRLKLQIHHSARYIFFARMNKKKNIFNNAKNKLVFPLGICGFFWNKFKTFLKKFGVFHSLNNFLIKIKIKKGYIKKFK
ncbi:MAG: glycosyltransferase family 2 protein [Treponema sp.]|nr:glycosyltransferase family 2 protein [Treponema sp.]